MRRSSVCVFVCALAAAALCGPASALAVPAAAPSSAPLATWQAQGRVSALAIANGVVYLGGSFTSLFSHGSPRKTVTRNHLAAVNEATGAPLAWNPNVNGAVHSIRVVGTRVYVGGSFTSIGGRPSTTSRRSAAAPATSITGLPRLGQRRGRRARRLGDEALPRRHVLAGRRLRPRQRRRGRPRHRRGRGRLGGPHQRRRPHAARRHRLGPRLHRRPLLGDRRQVAAVPGRGRREEGRRVRVGERAARPGVGARAQPAGQLYVGVGGHQGGQLDAYNAATGARRWQRFADGDVQTVSVAGSEILAGGHFLNACDTAGRRHPVGVHGADPARPLLRHRRGRHHPAVEPGRQQPLRRVGAAQRCAPTSWPAATSRS